MLKMIYDVPMLFTLVTLVATVLFIMHFAVGII